MIRMIQSTSAARAKSYFNDALLKSDYYLDDQELSGQFHGKIADRLGIKGMVTKEAFHALCENINPKTGDRLTPRSSKTRRVGYDINFHCSKSVSIVHALSEDDHILEAFKASVYETMLDIEADSKARVRKNGKNDERETGELVWADFVHQTSRPVDGSVPDCHLHSHCFVFNATFDKVEQQFKAGEFGDINRDMPYYQAQFHKRLADRLVNLGYKIRRTSKAFEIEGVPQKVIDLFSKRSNEIGKIAEEKGITDPKQKDKLGSLTRSKKQKGHTMAELKREWRKQIHDVMGEKDEGDTIIRHIKQKERKDVTSEKGIDPIIPQSEIDWLGETQNDNRNDTQEPEPRKKSWAEPKPKPPIEFSQTPQECIDYAILHCFERASVIRARKILVTAYQYALGNSGISIGHIKQAFENDTRILRVPNGKEFLCTTRQVLAEEKRMVDLARKGKGQLRPLYIDVPELKSTGQQAEAIRHVLTTTDQVSIIQGRAGAGKTTAIKELVTLIEKKGKSVTVVAPTNEASHGVLFNEGFTNAETVAKLLDDKKMQADLDGQVLLVDEAGMLDNQDMSALLALVHKSGARLILCGDTRQHSAVRRGDALRILNTVGGIKAAEVSRIYRQTHKEYREAVQALSDGNAKQAFNTLDKIGAIKPIDPLSPNTALVDDYLNTVKKGKSALVISPTHKQGDSVTAAIRERLRAEKRIGKKEVVLPRLINLNLTEAEKSNPQKLKPGQALQFNQNAKGIKRGSVWSITEVKDRHINISDVKGREISLPLDRSQKFDVFDKADIGVSRGDKIRITKPGFDADDKRLNNGQLLHVMSVNKRDNTIDVYNTVSKAEYRLPKNFNHIAHAHVITSHASQGKTVDEVFIYQPAATFPATDMKQFYVSVSRGRNRVHLYTDKKDELLQYASRMRDRESAMELIERHNKSKQMADDMIRQETQRQATPSPAITTKAKTVENQEHVTQRNYEPEI